jgi:hypothetical protein
VSFVVFAALMLSSVFAAQANAAATLTSDKDDYAPGEPAVLTGSGFNAGEMVEVQVVHVDGTPEGGESHGSWYVQADGSGSFSTTWIVCGDDCLGSTLEARAKGIESLLEASVL